MAGIDAPSQDLTTRIQATRKKLILSGDIEPHRPGERMLHGRAPGAALDIEQVSRAADLRQRRTGRTEVVEMDLTDYTGTQPGTKELIDAADADEPFAVGEEPDADGNDTFDLGDEPGTVDEDEPELDDEPDEPELGPVALDVSSETELLLLLDIAEQGRADAERRHEELLERLDGIGAGLIALANGLADQIDAYAIKADPQNAAAEPVPTPPPTIEHTLSGWARFWRALGFRVS